MRGTKPGSAHGPMRCGDIACKGTMVHHASSIVARAVADTVSGADKGEAKWSKIVKASGARGE